MKRITYIFTSVFILLTGTSFAQGDIEDLLYTEVDNLNPVYKPVVGFGVGYFSFFGDVKNSNLSPLVGTPGYKVNISTFIDNKHNIRANFFFMGGSLSGNERNYNNPMRNMNFKSDILLFGVNLNYDFDNFYKKYRKVHPYVAIGIGLMTFNSKIDSSYSTTEGAQQYYYWNDGSIRNMPYSLDNLSNPGLQKIQRDYTYETDLRDYDWGLGQYPQYAFTLPLDFGLDYWISDRLLFRVGASYNIVFSDVVDHVSAENTSGVIGDNKKHDSFLFTYLSMHLDLFSSKKTLAVQRLFADVDFDYTLYGDEDADGWFDGWDRCPGTPFGVETDTLGCPLDDDFDGVANYIDDEPQSRYGAVIDDRGVEISEDALIAKLDMSKAVRREDIGLYLRTPSSYDRYKNLTAKEIPPKFKNIDKDGDGYVSFDEILNEIDNFFDFETPLTPDDLYELNNFFFAQ